MKMKLFFAAMAVVFSLGVVSSCGNKKAAASAEETTEKVCDSTKVCCKHDSLACDSAKAACCQEEKAAVTAE
jgi:hypothetical protein